MKQKKEEITFSDITSIFAPKIWIIVIVSIICAVIMGSYSIFIKKDTYTSSATMYVHSKSSTSSSDLALAEKMIETYAFFLSTDDALREVISRVPDDYERKDELTTAFVKNSTAFISKGNGLFVIAVTTDDPYLSYNLAISFEVSAVELITDKFPSHLQITSFQSPENKLRPNSKGTIKNTAIGLVAGAVVSLVAVLAVSLFDSVIRSKKKIEDNMSVPVIGVIPVLNADNDHEIKNALQDICVRISRFNSENESKLISITSFSYNEDKTYVALNVAEMLAQTFIDQKVLIVDLDFNKVDEIEIFRSLSPDSDKTLGISKYLQNDVSTPDILSTSLPNLFVLNSGILDISPMGIINSNKMDELITKLSENYDYILFNTAPISEGSYSTALSDRMDGYVLIARERVTKIDELSAAEDSVLTAGGCVLGIILTDHK